MSVNRTPNERTGGWRRALEDWTTLEAVIPIWFAGMGLERKTGDLGKVTPKATFGYAAIRTGVRGVSFAPTYPFMARAEFPLTFAAQPESTAFIMLVAAMLGHYGIPAKSDHIAYKNAENLKFVAESQTIEGVASLSIPVVVPISDDAGGEGWLGGAGSVTVGDTGNITGSVFRAYQGVMADYVGVSYRDVSANVGQYFNTDVTILLSTPPIQVDSA